MIFSLIWHLNWDFCYICILFKFKFNIMKRLALTILIAVMALASQDVAAKTSKVAKGSIPFNKIVEMIATQSHWDRQSLSKIGLSKLVYKIEQDEESGDFYYYVYGKNVKVKSCKDWSVVLASKGRHAYAIEVALATDNGTTLYFKEKADHDAFMSKVRQSSYYRHDEHTECLGSSLIESDEYKNGWYMISFHAG